MKLNDLLNEFRKVDLEIKWNKSKVFTINFEKNLILNVNEVALEIVWEFPYLGSIVFSDRDNNRYLNEICLNEKGLALKKRQKNRVLNSTVKPILLYSSETWLITKIKKLQTYVNRYLRNILGYGD